MHAQQSSHPYSLIIKVAKCAIIVPSNLLDSMLSLSNIECIYLPGVRVALTF